MLRGRLLAPALVLLSAACGRAASAPAEPLPRGEWRSFEGSWSATGTRHTLELGPGHRAATVRLTGSLLLVGERRIGMGFRAEVIGFSDSRTGFTGRSVWTDEHGDEVYSEMQGQVVGSGNRVTGNFLGGTGRFEGLVGSYAFEWQYVVANEDGDVSGRAVGLTGRACLGPPPDDGPPAGEPPATAPQHDGPPAGEDRR